MCRCSPRVRSRKGGAIFADREWTDSLVDAKEKKAAHFSLTGVVERRRAAVEVWGQRPLQGPPPLAVPLRDAVWHAEAYAVDVDKPLYRIEGAEGMGPVDPCVVVGP